MADLKLGVKLVLDNGQYKAEIVSTEQLTKKFSATTEKGLDGSRRGFAALSGAAVKATQLFGAFLAARGLSDLVRGVVQTSSSFERLNAQLRTVVGSDAGARLAFERIQAFAATTPFQLDEVTDAFIRLKARALDPGQESLLAYGNIASGMSRSLEQVIEAVADAVTGEFERLKEFGIRASNEGDTIRFTFQGITTEVANSATEIESYLKRLGTVNFAGAMQNQMETLGGVSSNLEDAIARLALKIDSETGLTGALKRAGGALTVWLNALAGVSRPVAQIEADIQRLERRLTSLPTTGRASAARVSVVGDISELRAELRDALLASTVAGEVDRGIAALQTAIASATAEQAGLDIGRSGIMRRGRETMTGEVAEYRELSAEISTLNGQLEAALKRRAELLANPEGSGARPPSAGTGPSAKALEDARKAAQKLREQMLADEQAAIEQSIEARQIALKTEVDSAQAELDRSYERKLITDRQYFDARADLVDASYTAEIDLRERLLLIADAGEKQIVSAQIEDLKAKRLRALQDVADAERAAQQERLTKLQARVSGAITRNEQGASVVDARVATGGLTAAQGRGQLAETARQARTELTALRTELLALLDQAPNDPALIEALGQVQSALRQTRTEVEVLGDRVIGTFTEGATDAVADFASGTKSLGDAWSDAASGIVGSITRIVSELLVLAAAQQLVGIFTGGAFTLSGGQLTATGKASGGFISGPGGPTDDRIPARLSNGEYVIRASSVSKFGRGFFDALNAGFVPPASARRFAEGGFVGSAPAAGAGVTVQVVNQGEPMKVTRTEESRGSDGRDLYRVFVEPELRRDIAGNGPVMQQLLGALGSSRSPSRR